MYDHETVAEVGGLCLTYLTAFAPDHPIPRVLWEPLLLDTHGDFQQLQVEALQTLIDDGILLRNDDQALVVPYLVHRVTHLVLPEELLWDTIFRQAATVLQTKLQEYLVSNDTGVLMGLLPHARILTDRAIMRGDSDAYNLCYVSGKALLFLQQPDAELYLHAAVECYAVAPQGTLQGYLRLLGLLVTMRLARKDIQGAIGYLQRVVTASGQEFGPDHPMTRNAKDGLARLQSERDGN